MKAFTLTVRCDAPVCSNNTSVTQDDPGTALVFLASLGWSLGDYDDDPDLCPLCAIGQADAPIPLIPTQRRPS